MGKQVRSDAFTCAYADDRDDFRVDIECHPYKYPLFDSTQLRDQLIQLQMPTD
jgi:hypothetical protein